MSLSGWGLDVMQDAAATAVNMGSQAVGWGLQLTLPPSLLDNVSQLLPTGWSARLGLKQQQQQGYGSAVANGMQQHLLQQTTAAPALGIRTGSEGPKVNKVTVA